MERNNLSKLKSVLKVCFKIGNECAYDAFSNGFYFLERMDINISSRKRNTRLPAPAGISPRRRNREDPRALDRPHIRFLPHLFYPYKIKTTRFYNFYERFPEFIERRIMDVIM